MPVDDPSYLVNVQLVTSAVAKHYSGWRHVVHEVYQWQTLIAGAFAIAAAVGGYAAVRMQVSDARRQEREKYKRRALSLRSTLPMLLSDLDSYCRKTALDLFGAYSLVTALDVSLHGIERAGSFPDKPTFSEPPQAFLSKLSELVEVEDEGVSIALTKISSNIQILRSRLAYLSFGLTDRETIIAPGYVADRILDLAWVCCRCEDLFNLVRMQASDLLKDVSSDRAYRMCLSLDRRFEMIEDLRFRCEVYFGESQIV